MPQENATALKGDNVLQMRMEYGCLAGRLAFLLTDSLQCAYHWQVETGVCYASVYALLC
jgi:hypothetical protein